MNEYQKAIEVIDTLLHLMCGEEREDGYKPTMEEMSNSMDLLKELANKADSFEQYTLIDNPRNLENLKIENLNPIKLNNNSNKNELNKNNINVCMHKHKYGEFQHVLLTDKEHTHLLDLYGDSLDEHIKILDEYIETSGKKYKNHSLVIQKWVHDEWMKRNKDKPITLDSKFYAEQNTKTDKEVEDEFNRLREQLFRKVFK